MKISETVRNILEQDAKNVILATSSTEGAVDVAMFGSLRAYGEGGLELMLGDNRTWKNLQANPYAACLITLHGTTGLGTQGCRLYLKLTASIDDGEEVDAFRNELHKRIGAASDMLKHLVRFQIVEARPILDLGQGI
ncbi:MAG TPA: pyridoxamine 5'-phosphate oxidase family protein [Deltaproteobacteria bacterium]|nr:pyridoxamine 5'-phosphate oxidase family protein [Deltaproteobacteria bacterium]